MGTVAASRYASARQLIAALTHGGLSCTGASYNTPVVSGASSEASCNFTASQTPLIDVFPGTVTTAQVLRNSVSTGTQKIWSDVGPNWWVQANRVYATRIQRILGGHVVGGPWHQGAGQPSAAQDPALQVCQGFTAIDGMLSAILNHDEENPSAVSPDGKLNGYADQMSHWSYVITQAVADGSTAASIQFANDLGDAGIATVQVAEPLGHGVTPDVHSAAQDVSGVQDDCTIFAG
jgi:hypothetical protein